MKGQVSSALADTVSSNGARLAAPCRPEALIVHTAVRRDRLPYLSPWRPPEWGGQGTETRTDLLMNSVQGLSEVKGILTVSLGSFSLSSGEQIPGRADFSSFLLLP